MVPVLNNLQCGLIAQAGNDTLQKRHVAKRVPRARNEQHGVLNVVEMAVPQLVFPPGLSLIHI